MTVMWCLLVFIAFLNTVSADEKVKGHEGDEVILPCVHNGTNPKLFWRYQKPEMKEKNVYTLIDGKEYLEDQDTQFRNRTRMFPSEYDKGNFSLLLTDLSQSDAGDYLCFDTNHNALQTVQLAVKGKQQATTAPPKGNTAETRSNTCITVLLMALYGVIFHTVE